MIQLFFRVPKEKWVCKESYLSVAAGFARNTSIFLFAELLTSKGVICRAGDEIHVQRVLWNHPEVIPVPLYQL